MSPPTVSPPAYANSFSCCRSSPTERCSRSPMATTDAPSRPMHGSQPNSLILSSHGSDSIPSGFVTAGRSRDTCSGAGVKAAANPSTVEPAIASHARTRHRRDGRWPFGNSRNRNSARPAGNTGTTDQFVIQAAQSPPDSEGTMSVRL